MRPLVTTILVLMCWIICMSGGEAKKEFPTHPAFPPAVQEAIGCDVCVHAITNVHNEVDKLRIEKFKKSIKLREDEILGVLERVCNPFIAEGEWIRRVAILVTASGQASPSARGDCDIRTEVLHYFSVCKRTCYSIKNICEYILDQDEMDPLPARLLKLARKQVSLVDEDVVRATVEKVCLPLDVCEDSTQLRRALNAELLAEGEEDGSLRSEILADAPEKISTDEMEMERLMRTMRDEENRKSDVFGRDEIVKLQEAIMRGDKDAAKELDPRSMDLSDDEFEALRMMMLDEGGDL